jgi:hypothetical protein
VKQARKQSSAFLKKSAQKTFAPAGVWTGIAFKRILRSRLKAIPVQTPAVKRNFLLLFFKKEVLAFFPWRPAFAGMTGLIRPSAAL